VKQSAPPGGIRPLFSTTNPGKFRLSLPRPYVTHDPPLGRPWRPEPVCMK
jgi:hypothetical protein